MESLVSVRKCDTYDLPRVGSVVEQLLNDLGGLSSFIRRGQKVLLKPNLLRSAAASSAAVTHPAVVEAIASLVIDCGAVPFVGDSPPLGNLSRVLSKCGYTPFMERLGVKPVPFLEKQVCEFPENRIFRRIDLAREVFDYDAVINIPKLKTHTQMFLTLAVKNLFGAIIGTDKASWHLKAGKDHETFATVLVQIYEKVRPILSVVDGILAMEGNGPNSGKPREVGIVAASTDPVALDATVCRLLGFDSARMLTCSLGQAQGLGVAEEHRIKVAGEKLDGFPLKNFKAPKTMTMTWNLSGRNPIRRFMENHMVTRPRIDQAECQGCKICLEHCPPEAITEKNGKMIIDYRKCISCFCCHELCTNEAIEIEQPLFGRLLSRVLR
jgi:uncharacterized protein (DUF362 family)/Pyruvate/2-oxoacid:ferredoxin oxidoreductase delta subunit